MDNKTKVYKASIEDFMTRVGNIATASDIPFISVFQLNDDYFVLSHNVGENAHKEMQQNVEWWTDYLDGKYDNKTIITDEDMQKANETVKEIAQYVESKGFHCTIDPLTEIETIKRLRIFKMVDKDRVHCDVAFSVGGLLMDSGKIWQFVVDGAMQKVDEAIEKGPPPLTAQELSDADPYVRIEDEETGRIRAIPESALKKLLSEPVAFTDEQKAQIADLAREQRLRASREASPRDTQKGLHWEAVDVKTQEVVVEGYMPDPRDTQFAGFAGLLWDELITSDAERYGDQQRLLIAQRVYDLVAQSADFVMDGAILPKEAREEVSKYIMSKIPDMTEWPKEDETLEKITRDVQRVMG